jgi:hypothetical protein
MKVALVALAVLLVTAGCARADDTAAPAPSPSQAAPTVEPSLPITDLPLPSKPAPGAAGAQTLTGTVTSGVEPGCVLLSGSAGSHLLIFDDPTLKAKATSGSRVVVTGKADPGMMTTCQQGTPFLVTDIRPA